MQPRLRFYSSSTLLPKVFILFTYISVCYISSCSYIDKPLSEEYITGQKEAEIYAKQDAIDSRCINYPVALQSNILNNTKKHIKNFEEEKSLEFISGFSKGYQDFYKEYMNLYCDNLDSINIELDHERPKQ